MYDNAVNSKSFSKLALFCLHILCNCVENNCTIGLVALISSGAGREQGC
uniref:Uncharacterized protein n=1 Tax=Anguilla anguilla TaxID=7936 RepID=A0A0E9TJ70_ANGAN